MKNVPEVLVRGFRFEILSSLLTRCCEQGLKNLKEVQVRNFRDCTLSRGGKGSDLVFAVPVGLVVVMY